jgi:hypothetical protein
MKFCQCVMAIAFILFGAAVGAFLLIIGAH